MNGVLIFVGAQNFSVHLGNEPSIAYDVSIDRDL